MKNNTTRKTINVDKPNLMPLWTLKQEDDVVLKLALFKEATPFSIVGQTIRLGAKTLKGLKEQIDGFTIKENELDIALKNSILVPGLVEIDLEFKDVGGKMTSTSFFINVDSKVLNNAAVEATNEFSTFEKAVQEINTDYNSLKGGLLATDKVVYFQNEINKTNSSLEQKLNKDGIVTMANMGQDVKTAMTGGSVAVVDKNAILTENIVDKQVIEEKVSFVAIEEKPNLFNKDDVVIGFSSGEVGANYYITYNEKMRNIVIPIEENATYTVTGTSYYYHLLDSSMKYIFRAGQSSTSVSNLQISTITGAKYLSVNFDYNKFPVETFMIVKGDTLPTSYTSYKKSKLKENFFLNTNQKDEVEKIINNITIKNGIIMNKEYNELIKNNINGKLIYNKTNITVTPLEGYYRIGLPVTSTSNIYDIKENDKLYALIEIEHQLEDREKIAENFVIRTYTSGNYNFTRSNGKWLTDNLLFISFNVVFPLDYINTDFIVFSKTFSNNIVIKSVKLTCNGLDISQKLSKTFYVSQNGNDSNGGQSDTDPLLSFQSAINRGAETIIAKEGIYSNQRIVVSGKENFRIYVQNNSGNPKGKATLDNSYIIDGLILNDGLYKVAFTPPNTKWQEMFIDKTLPLIHNTNPSNKIAYNVTLWAIYNDNKIINDYKYKPVLTLEECKSESKTFFFDGTYLYINDDITSKTIKTVYDEINDQIYISNCNDVYIEDLKVLHGGFKNIFIEKVNYIKEIGVISGYASKSGGNALNFTNGELENCISYKCHTDGLGGSNNGNTKTVHCKSFYNYDDGISHHDGNTGVIIGGEFYGNGKGGIAPAHGSQFEAHNVICHDNKVGFYCESADDRNPGRDMILTNCLAYNNETGLILRNYHLTTFNCNFENNTIPKNIKSVDVNTSLKEF